MDFVERIATLHKLPARALYDLHAYSIYEKFVAVGGTLNMIGARLSCVEVVQRCIAAEVIVQMQVVRQCCTGGHRRHFITVGTVHYWLKRNAG